MVDLALANEKLMTVKEVAEIFNVSDDTILRAAKELFPDIIKNGKTTFLNEYQVTCIKLKIGKNYSLRNGAELQKTDLEKQLLIKQGYDLLLEDIESLKKDNDTKQNTINNITQQVIQDLNFQNKQIQDLSQQIIEIKNIISKKDNPEESMLNNINKNQKLLLSMDINDAMDNFLYENFVIDFSRYDFFTSNQMFAYIYEAHFQTKLPARFKREFIKKYGLNSNGFKRNNENKVERGIQFLKIKI